MFHRIAMLLGLWLALVSPAPAQDRLKTLPNYERFASRSREIPGSVKLGTGTATWRDGGKSLDFRRDGKTTRYDLVNHRSEVVTPDWESASGGRPPGRGSGRVGPERGRQYDSAPSPDGSLKAFHRDRNLWVSDPKGLVELQLTHDGNSSTRVKNAQASWVYGEELDQNTAFWWSPDGTKIAFYRFDESKVADYFLQLDQTRVQDRLDVEPYPKSGQPNPVADLLVYDLKARTTVKLDVRDGRAGDDPEVGHYVYNVRWSPDGNLILFHRTNRRQNVLELAAADPATGKVRVVVRDEWLPSWVTNNPETRFLADGHRFLRATTRNGWKNYDLHDLADGKLVSTITRNEFDADRIVRVDEEAKIVDYLAHDGDNPMKLQLHRVNLDGSGDRRLTDPALHHTVDVAPDGRHFVDVIQTHDTPPVTRVVDADGKVVETLAESNAEKFAALGLQKVELFRFHAGDGQTELYGLLHKPSDFDQNRRYPVLVSVYAGPETNGARETFTTPNPLTELGYLVVSLDSRSAAGRGKAFLDAIYLKFGQTEIDDQAAGVRALRDRPYVDPNRVGIFGTSYGGYASILALLRHPDTFQAACASSSVTDYRHYDTIYTERYMRTPAENPADYDAGSAVKLADKLRGRLMLFYGTADNNVHPSNTLQLVQALQRAGKSFDLQVGPDAGHASISRDRMMEFFADALPTRNGGEPSTAPPGTTTSPSSTANPAQ